MKKYGKQVISVVLVVVLCFMISVPVFAKSQAADENIVDTINYIDSEGQPCSVVVEINVLEKTVVTRMDSYDATEFVFDLNEQSITITNPDGTVEREALDMIHIKTVMPMAVAASTYIGHLEYKPYYDPMIGEVQDSLAIYSTQNGYKEKDTYVINGEQAELASKVIGLLTTYLFGRGLKKLATKAAESIWGDLILSGVTSVVKGAITKAFTTTVEAETTFFIVEAIDQATNRSNTYESSSHRLTAPAAKFDDIYYEGIYPQFLQEKDVAVASWLFSDFFAYSFPGVKSYGRYGG